MGTLNPAPQVERLGARYSDPAFAEARARLDSDAARALEDALLPNPEGDGWSHDFICPEHSVWMLFELEPNGKYQCPVGGEWRTGEILDGGWRSTRTERIAIGADACRSVWLATGSEAHRDYARDVLLAYSSFYESLPPNGVHVGTGRVTGQALDESMWSIKMTRAYDAIRETLDPAQRDLIEQHLFRPALEHLLSERMLRLHNIECWLLAGIVHLAAALGDNPLVSDCLDGEFGLLSQLTNAVGAEGLWVEGSPTYHFFALDALLNAAVGSHGIDDRLVDHPALRAMPTAPLAYVRGDLSLPAHNDGWVAVAEPYGLLRFAGHFERAYGLWADPVLVTLLRSLYTDGRQRSSEWSLTHGPDLARDASAPLPPTVPVQADAGIASLRAGSDQVVTAKFGPRGGGHGHPDKLSIDVHGFGARIAPDLGTPAYASPLMLPWFRQTFAHNTVTIGGESQPMARGRLLSFRPHSPEGGVIDAAVSWSTDPLSTNGPVGPTLMVDHPQPVRPAYLGASIRRAIVSAGGETPYFIDVVLVRPVGSPSVELSWLPSGSLVAGAGEPLEWSHDPATPYGQLADVTAVIDDRLEWDLDGVRTRLWWHRSTGLEGIAATGPGNPTFLRQSVFVRRTSGTAAFAAVFESARGAGAVASVDWIADDLLAGGALRLAVNDDEWSITLGEGETPAEVIRS